MSGIYLHGLVIMDGKEVLSIVVEDNVFSHSELRKIWLLTEQNHKSVYEWSWDYVTRKFVETTPEIALVAQTWIDKNLSNRAQLRAWIDRNWQGLTQEEGETVRMWHLCTLLKNAKSSDPLVQRYLDTYKAWKQADEAWKQAEVDWFCRIMKPVFMGLFDRYCIKGWV